MIHELHCHIQELEYRNALQDEDIQIMQAIRATSVKAERRVC